MWKQKCYRERCLWTFKTIDEALFRKFVESWLIRSFYGFNRISKFSPFLVNLGRIKKIKNFCIIIVYIADCQSYSQFKRFFSHLLYLYFYCFIFFQLFF